MSKLRNNISVLFLLVAVGGLLFSLAHYHSEGLECLEHAKEQHFAETDPICPICSVITPIDLTNQMSFSHELTFLEFMIAQPEEVYFSIHNSRLKGRSPPFSA